MVHEFEFPDTGEGVTEGTFLEWLVDEGEEIEEDQPVAEVETDKAVVDIPAPASGVMKDQRVKPGDKVKVGQIIMAIATEEDPEGTTEEAEEPEKGTEEDQTQETEKKKDEEQIAHSSSDSVLALPKVRKLAEDEGVDLESLDTEGRITEEDVLDAKGSTEAVKENKKEKKETTKDSPKEEETEEEIVDTSDVKATPAVRKLAREKGVDIGSIEGSGRGGKVTRDDVISASKSTGTSETEKREVSGETERVDMSPVRKAISHKMSESVEETAMVTHVEKADVTRLVELREKKKDEVDVHLTYLPFVLKAVYLGLREFPDLNAELDEENDQIVRKKDYNFGIAVDTDRGLLVPVIDDIDEKNILELASEIEEKAEKTREGELSREEMEGGTFSVTNVGVIGGESFTPIINYPEVGILGIGSIKETAEVVDGEVEPRHTVKLSLSFDHRVVDGATAARFMNIVKENLEDPGEMLVEL